MKTTVAVEIEDPRNLEQAAKAVACLRGMLLTDGPDEEDLCPRAEQEYLLAHAALEQAERLLRLADLSNAQEIGAFQLGRAR